MLNDFTGGGQIFLHKLRMFFQVLHRSCLTAVLASLAIVGVISYKPLQNLDLKAAATYQKAVIADGFDEATSLIRNKVNPRAKYYYTTVDAYDHRGLYAKDIDPRKIIRSSYFKDSYSKFLEFLKVRLVLTCCIMLGIFVVIYVLWSKFGKDVKSESIKEGSDKVLSAIEVSKVLKAKNKASHLHIGQMPLVKNSETKHFLVTGATGSGKTNLIHNILPQIIAAKQPAIVIDQTGEMIAEYYSSKRGDIIFNPFDARSRAWDFWHDCATDEELERFAKILFSFNRKQTGHSTDPFWERSAETVFNAIVKLQRASGNRSIAQLCNLVRNASLKKLQSELKDTEAARYLAEDSKTTASSILSVLAVSTVPLKFLTNANTQSFSLKEYFYRIDQGSGSWLYLAAKPSARDLTLPLVACLTELAFSRLLDIGIKQDRRVWFVIDELSSLGKLPALSTLMAEGRKYGACVLSGLQSLNQLYANYGQYEGSTIFGQFGTNFFFRNNEPAIAKMVSNMCGKETVYRQQKNTSFGAHEFRDGVSYSEQQQQKDLVEYSDLANLKEGECFVLLPEPSVRVARLHTPAAGLAGKNAGFIQATDIPGKIAAATIEEEDILSNRQPSAAAGTINNRKELAQEQTDTGITNDKDEHDLAQDILLTNS